ncbi:hypothetical protein QBC43DRAFT_294587 [Cladorrhinum sp. PSN259]|nr:hypothetical protein QBC43DRAFT_294587 [Cladorrhinum sp. PSN259]
MDNENQSWQVIERPLIAYAPRCADSPTLPECYDHWDLPEVYDPSDFPEAYIPVLINNRQAVVPYSPSLTRPSLPPTKPASLCSVSTAKSPVRKPFWRRHWVVITVIATLVIICIIAGAVTGTLLSHRHSAESSLAEDISPPTSSSSSPSASSGLNTSKQSATTTSSQSVSSPSQPTTQTSTTSTPTSSSSSSSSSSTTTAKPLQPTGDPTLPTVILSGGAKRPQDPPEAQLQVVFLPGQECNYTVIGKAGDNPCSKPWNLAGRTYTLEGCGGVLWAEAKSPQARFFGYCPSTGEPVMNCKESGMVVFGAYKCTLQS